MYAENAPFYDELLRYFIHEVQDAHEAQDLVQEAHGRVLARAAAGESIQNLRGLLYEVARNLLIDRYRQLQVRKHACEEALAKVPAPTSDEPEVRYAGQQRVRLLEQTIAALPLRCRQALRGTGRRGAHHGGRHAFLGAPYPLSGQPGRAGGRQRRPGTSRPRWCGCGG